MGRRGSLYDLVLWRTLRKGTLPDLGMRPGNVLASVRLGEWVNTVRRTFSLLVVKAVHFKIRENSWS